MDWFFPLRSGGVAMLIATSPAGATSASLLGCDILLIREMAATDLPAGSRDALDQARLFFGRISMAELDTVLGEVPPGTAVEVTERFRSDDARWRFLRPLDLPDDPDSLILSPPQRQFLIRPQPGSPARALLLAGTGAPDGDPARLATPMLAGIDRQGGIFLADPLRPEDCLWPVAAVGAALTPVLHSLR